MIHVEEIGVDGKTLAIIIHRDEVKPGVEFPTPPDANLQVGFMHHAAGTEITPHEHVAVGRKIEGTSEVLIIERGSLRADFYAEGSRRVHESRILNAGTVVLLLRGGHGFTALSDLTMIEVKQGPYVGEHDKVRFSAREGETVDI